MTATPFITLEELVDRHGSEKLIDIGLDSLRPVAIDNFGDTRVEHERNHETATLIRAAIIGDTNAYGFDTVHHARDLTFMWRQDLVDRLLEHEAGVTQGHEASGSAGAAVFESDLVLSDEEVVILTRRVQPAAQVRQLRAMAIDHRRRRDGSVVVLRSTLEAANTSSLTRHSPAVEPDFGALSRNR